MISYFLKTLQGYWRADSQIKDGTESSPEHEVLVQSKDNISVEPLNEFEWTTAPRTIFHPYQPEYKMLFGMKSLPVSELIDMDKTYLDHITERKQIIALYGDSVVGSTPQATLAVKELFEWVTATYLPRRFPTMFRLESSSTGKESESFIRNLVDGQRYSLEFPECPDDALAILGSLVDEDFLLTLPAVAGSGYVLNAFVNCFANGSSTRARMGKSISNIHRPVPGYEQHLAKRLDQWMTRLEPSEVVMRSNWVVTDDDRMFVPDGYSPWATYEGPLENIDPGNTFVRTERQTLHKLPHSGAIVFGLKTYLYPVQDIKASGYGAELANAIDGLSSGKVPAIADYKKQGIWGEAVKTYLLNEDKRL